MTEERFGLEPGIASEPSSTIATLAPDDIGVATEPRSTVETLGPDDVGVGTDTAFVVTQEPYRLTVAGIDRSAIAEQVRYTHRAYGDTSRLSFELFDEQGTVTVADDEEVILTADGVKVFAGYVRQRRQSDTGVASQRRWMVECQDYTTLLAEDVVDVSATRPAGESDSARIAALFATFGTRNIVIGPSVQTLRASMPEQTFFGLTLHQCLTEIAKVTRGSFFVDFDKVLHYFRSETLVAPFSLSDNPNGSTTFGYEEFSLAHDSTLKVNAVFVVGTGVSLWRYLGGTPPPVSSRRATVLNDPAIVDTAEAQARGDDFLATYGSSAQPSSLVTYKHGLRAGMLVNVTHSGHGIAGVPYRITSIDAEILSRRVKYTVLFGSRPADITDILGRTESLIGAAVGQAAEAVAAVADLSVGGGNQVRNSSFEDQTAWGADSGWAVGFDPVTPDEPFHGSKTARFVGSSAGNALHIPLAERIPVAISDHYWISAWRFVRSMAGGSFRMEIRELTAAGAVAATHTIDVTTADSEWRRMALHFAPAAGPGITAWHLSTKSIRILFYPLGTGTKVVDIDGVQVERGKLLTAYAPAPYELVDQSVGTTKIEDDAVTSAKIIANAVVAGKVAADAIGAAQIQANAIGADKIDAGAVRAQHLLIAGGRSPLIDNPDFEAGSFEVSGEVDGWVVTQPAGATVRITDDWRKNGSRSARVTNGAAGVASIRSSTFPVLASEPVTLSFWHLGAGTCRVWLWVQSDTGGITVIGPFVDAAAGATWTQRLIKTAVLATSVRAAWLFENIAASTNLYIDDVQPSRTMDVLSADGDVVSNPGGLTVLNGKIVVSNAGSIVIIDGTSNMFKIVGSGTIAVGSLGVGGLTGTFLTLFTNLGYRPAHLVYVLLTSGELNPGVAETLLVPIYQWNSGTGLVDRSYRAGVQEKDADETNIYFETRSRAGHAATTYRYYVLKEAAV